MASYQLTEHCGAGYPSRFYIDGRRVSRSHFNCIRDKAHREGKIDCLLTVGKQLDGGRIRRTNYSCATFP